MDLLAAWLLFPLTVAALSLGVGLLVDRFAGAQLSVPLLIAGGFAAIVVLGDLLTALAATAPLATPVVAALAALGLVLGARARLPAAEPVALLAAAAVLVVYAAPIVLSGEPTIAGFIKLDDTATWLALTDRVIDHGRDLGGLAPSTYEATLHFNLGEGYPVGAFVPFGIASELNPLDRAWLIQPYMACAGRDAGARPLVAGLGPRRPAGPALARGGDRRAAGAALRLLPLGRDQGGARRGADRRHRRAARASARARPGARPAALAGGRRRGRARRA